MTKKAPARTTTHRNHRRATAPDTSPTRPPADRTIAVVIVPAVADARVEVQVSTDTWLKGETNEDGYVAFQCSDSLGDSVLEIITEEYEYYLQSVHWHTLTDPVEQVGTPPLNCQMTVGGNLPPLTPKTIVAPPDQSGGADQGASEPGVIVPLHADGVTLRNASGARVSLCGYDMFTALRMLLDGQSLDPFIAESQRYGFNCWRVFGMASATENGYYTVDPREPGYYDALGRLAQLLTNAGIYLLHTCYADNQVIGCGVDHWTQTADVLRPFQEGVFLSGGNEWQKNGFDPASLPAPGMKWWSRGSSLGDSQPPSPRGASFVEFHPRRDYPKALDDTVASATWIEYQYGYVLPLVIDEPPRMGEDGSGDAYLQPGICWQFARHYASQCAGAVFHARPGQKGSLIVAGSGTEACAKAWVDAWDGVAKA